MQQQIEKIKTLLSCTDWEAKAYGSCYCTTLYKNRDLYWCFALKENEEIKRIDLGVLARMYKNLKTLELQALKFIDTNFPEEDNSALSLDDIIFYPDNSFSLGFDTGESPAGQLFLYVQFDKELNRSNKLIYETY